MGYAMFPKTCRDSSMVLITERLCSTLAGWEGGEDTPGPKQPAPCELLSSSWWNV